MYNGSARPLGLTHSHKKKQAQDQISIMIWPNDAPIRNNLERSYVLKGA